MTEREEEGVGRYQQQNNHREGEQREFCTIKQLHSSLIKRLMFQIFPIKNYGYYKLIKGLLLKFNKKTNNKKEYIHKENTPFQLSQHETTI